MSSEKKRTNEKQLIKDDDPDERPTDVEPDAFDHGIKKADETTLAQRKIVKAKRPTANSAPTTSAPTSNLFNFDFTTKSTPKSEETNKKTTTEPEKVKSPTKSEENNKNNGTNNNHSTNTTTTATISEEKKSEPAKPPQFTFNFGSFTPSSTTASTTTPTTTTTPDSTDKPKPPTFGFNFNFSAPTSAFSPNSSSSTSTNPSTTSSTSSIPVFSFNTIAASNSNGGLQFAISNANSTSSSLKKKDDDDEDNEEGGEGENDENNNEVATLKTVKEPILPEVQVTTGEEDEETILEFGRVKLYKLENKKDWKEKGVGRLKLKKHKITKKTRIIMRTDGAMKLILNAPLFPAMNPKSLSANSVNFTGVDEDGQLSAFSIRVGKTDNINELLDKLNQNKDN